MKPDYKNWIPKGMIYSFMAAFLICAAVITVLTITLEAGTVKTVLTVVFAVLTLVFGVTAGVLGIVNGGKLLHEGKKLRGKEGAI